MRQFERLVELYHSANIRTKYVKNTGCLFDIIVKIDSQIRRHFHCAVTNKLKKRDRDSITVSYWFNQHQACFSDRILLLLQYSSHTWTKAYSERTKQRGSSRCPRCQTHRKSFFLEVFIGQYGSVEELKEALDRRPQKRKRGRPRKVTYKSA